MNRLLFCLIGLLALTSCSKNFSLFSTDPDVFNLNNVDYEYMAIKSKIKYDDDTQKHKGTANIRIKRDSIIWFSITPGMGIEAARGVILKDSIKLINKISKQYTVASIDELRNKIHFDLDLAMTESMLIGNLIWPIGDDDKITRNKGFYVITKEYGDLLITNYIGANSKKLEKIEAVSDSSQSMLTVSYSNFQDINETVIPTKIDVQIKYDSKMDNTQKMSNITIEHVKVEIDQKKLKFSFSIPKKYTVR